MAEKTIVKQPKFYNPITKRSSKYDPNIPRSTSGKKIHKLVEYPEREIWVLNTINYKKLEKDINSKYDGLGERLLFFMSVIYRRNRFQEKFNNEVDAFSNDDRFCYFSKKELRNIFSDKRQTYLKLIINAGYLDVDYRLTTGKNAPVCTTSWFRISDKYMQAHLINGKPYHKVKVKTQTVKRIARNYYDDKKELKLNELDVPTWNAIRPSYDVLEDLISISLKTIVDTRSKLYLKVKTDFYDIEDIVAVYNLKEERYFKVDSFGLRFHSTEVSFPSEVRLCLRDEDDIDALVCEIDIKNSQPYFAGMVLLKPELAGMIVPGIANSILQLKRLPYNTAQDFKDYLNDSISGKIYEKFAEEMDRKIPNWLSQKDWYDEKKRMPSTKRDGAKQLIFSVLFGPSRMVNQEYKQVFMDLYPTTFEAFSIIKGFDWREINPSRMFRNNKPTEQPKKYSNMAFLMQRVERYIMIDKIGVELYKLQLWRIMVHDSFVVKEHDAGYVKKIMEGQIQLLELPLPQLKISGNCEDAGV